MAVRRGGVGIQQFEPLLVMLASYMGTIWVPAALLLIELLDNALGEAVEDRPSDWACVTRKTYMGF